MKNIKTIWVIQTGSLQLSNDICHGVKRYVQINKTPWRVRFYSPTEKELQTQSFLQWDEVDGVIMAPTRKMTALARSSPFPIVLTDADYEIPSFPQVDVNNYQTGKLAAEYFLRKGFRSFFYAETPFSTERGRGFQETLRPLGFDVHTFSLKSFSLTSARRLNAIKKMTQALQHIQKPVALYCEHDPLAADIILTLQEHGFHIPNDVAVLGTQNDTLTCETSTPYISSIRLPYEEVGYESARIVDLLLRGRKPPAEPIRLNPLSITERQSTHLMAVPDSNVQKAITYIQTHACSSIKVREVAQVAGLSLRALQARFQNALGYTLQEEIRRVRINRTKTLLETTSLPLSEITEQVGYTDPSYLISAFRTATGMTPGNYRKQFKT